mmetsp:Transcript_17542/g.41192  ORF Transcript_17542/g.41192 Transcript_17542/m.41192 type:complete len:254 (+) Transcript_17542:95-856(+)
MLSISFEKATTKDVPGGIVPCSPRSMGFDTSMNRRKYCPAGPCTRNISRRNLRVAESSSQPVKSRGSWAIRWTQSRCLSARATSAGIASEVVNLPASSNDATVSTTSPALKAAPSSEDCMRSQMTLRRETLGDCIMSLTIPLSRFFASTARPHCVKRPRSMGRANAPSTMSWSNAPTCCCNWGSKPAVTGNAEMTPAKADAWRWKMQKPSVLVSSTMASNASRTMLIISGTKASTAFGPMLARTLLRKRLCFR